MIELKTPFDDLAKAIEFAQRSIMEWFHVYRKSSSKMERKLRKEQRRYQRQKAKQ